MYTQETIRLLIPSTDIPVVESILNDIFIDYDFDGGNRIMVNDTDLDEVVDALNRAYIDFDII